MVNLIPTEKVNLSDYSSSRSRVSNPKGSYVFSSCSVVNLSPTERVNLSDYSALLRGAISV